MRLHQRLRSPQSSEQKDKKSSRSALVFSVLFHTSILLLVGGVVLIPAVTGKKEFIGNGGTMEPLNSTVDAPPDTSNLQNELPNTQAPQDSLSLPEQENSVVPTDVIVARQDTTIANSSWANSVSTSSINVKSPSFSQGGGAGGSGEGSGGGEGTGSFDGKVTIGRMTLFGNTKKESGTRYGLEGYFYDLKQDGDKKPTDMKGVTNVTDFNSMFEKEKLPNEKASKLMIQFVKSGFKTSELQKYYRVKDPLYLSFLMIPDTDAEIAPREFNVEKEVQPRRWIVHYTGKITPKESGKYRFWGIGDDLLFLSINKKLALNGSLGNYPGLDKEDDLVFFEPDKKSHPNKELYDPTNKEEYRHNLYPRIGKWIRMNEGESYVIDLMISEIPGGTFKAQLLVEQDGVEYKKNPDGFPILPIFRLNETKANTNIQNEWNKVLYKFSKEGPVFNTVE